MTVTQKTNYRMSYFQANGNVLPGCLLCYLNKIKFCYLFIYLFCIYLLFKRSLSTINTRSYSLISRMQSPLVRSMTVALYTCSYDNDNVTLSTAFKAQR